VLTVVHGDSPADAKVGLVEALLATAPQHGEHHVLQGVSVEIAAAWPQQSALPDPRGLFGRLARAAAAEGTAAQAAEDGRTWAALTFGDGSAMVTAAAVSGEVLSSVDELWQQALAACRSLPATVPPLRRIAVSLHFQTMRLSAAHRAAAESLLDAWEPDRTS
jgi:hypothetical protein